MRILHFKYIKQFQFQSPTTISMYAPPQSGKTTLTNEILKASGKLFTKPPEKIVYCYNQFLPILDSLERTLAIPFLTHQGIPSKETLEQWSNGKHFIIVMDDLQQVCERNREAADMFTVGSHHMNFSLIYLCHQIFNKASFSRTITLNCHYLIVFINNTDQLQIDRLGRRIFGHKKYKYFVSAFTKATKKPWGYLLINNHPTVRDEELRLVTNILPHQNTIVYMPK